MNDLAIRSGGGAATLDAVPGSPAAPAATGVAGFQALLERLQAMTAKQQAAPAPVADDAETLATAMRDADASFTTAMDLRRQLEAAFRRHLP